VFKLQINVNNVQQIVAIGNTSRITMRKLLRKLCYIRTGIAINYFVHFPHSNQLKSSHGYQMNKYDLLHLSKSSRKILQNELDTKHPLSHFVNTSGIKNRDRFYESTSLFLEQIFYADVRDEGNDKRLRTNDRFSFAVYKPKLLQVENSEGQVRIR